MERKTDSQDAADLGGLIRSGRTLVAIAECRRRLAIDPGDGGLWVALGNLHDDLGATDEAEAAYREATRIAPGLAEGWYNLGLLLQGQRRLEEAEGPYRQAIALRPDLVFAHNNLGAALRDLRRLDEADAAFEAALARRPDYADAQFNQAMCRLAMGDFARGWAQYEWRWRIDQARGAGRTLNARLWLGREDLTGRSILLHAEQGFGDTLQFCRFTRLVRARGALVSVEVQPGLERLLSRLEGAAEVFAAGRPLPPFDFHTPLMSLPLALNAGPDAVGPPYLGADPMMARAWARRLLGPSERRIGLCWAGAARPDQPIASAVDQRRSLPLAAFAPLAGVEGARFFSLQKGAPACQLASLRREGWAGPEIIDHTAELRDFADTAALIANLDLVITCDTSVAHLAGAMGKPVWILSRLDGCWRWLDGREDSPWYPSARLFWQSVRGEWGDVIARVSGGLKVFVSGS